MYVYVLLKLMDLCYICVLKLKIVNFKWLLCKICECNKSVVVKYLFFSWVIKFILNILY